MTTKRNVTLALPVELIRKVKIQAAKEGKSINTYARQALEERLREQSGYEAARRRQLSVLRSGFDLGTRGAVGLSRDEIHGR